MTSAVACIFSQPANSCVYSNTVTLGNFAYSWGEIVSSIGRTIGGAGVASG